MTPPPASQPAPPGAPAAGANPRGPAVAPPVARLLDFSGRVVLVTGAGAGIGRGIARRFAEAGAHVAVHARSHVPEAEALVRELRRRGGRAVALAAELTEPAAVSGLIERTVADLEGLDVVINNAGTYPLDPLLAMAPERWQEVVAANLSSAFLVTQAAARSMIARGVAGAIVNVTSIEAADPAPAHAHYNAAKGGLAMLTRAAALELGPSGVRVNAVAPGLIDREGLESAWPEGVARYRARAPLGRLGTPEEVADACLFLASPAARWITGASLTVDGGVTSTQSF